MVSCCTMNPQFLLAVYFKRFMHGSQLLELTFCKTKCMSIVMRS